MTRVNGIWATLVVVAGLLALVASCSPASPASPVASTSPTKRLIYLAAIEPKGSTTASQESFPTAELPQGGGYILKAPDKEGRWEVSTYRFTPGTIVVYQGDEVTLEIVGINGKEHPSSIEGYNVNFTIRRGQATPVTFKADKAGIFNIVCHTHRPSMTAQLVVLPRS